MPLPPIERTLNLRPSGPDGASLTAARAVHVAPNRPAATATPSIQPTPSVINLVNLANKPNEGEGVYTSVSDPARRGSEAATVPKDWTIHRPVAEKVEDPPPVPMAKLLIEHVKAMWTASASAIQVEQVKNQLEASQPKPEAAPGLLATEVFTYSPSKINKTEKM